MERELRRKKQFQYNQEKKSLPNTLKGTKTLLKNFHSNPIVNNETYGCEVANDLLPTNQMKILEKMVLLKFLIGKIQKFQILFLIK